MTAPKILSLLSRLFSGGDPLSETAFAPSPDLPESDSNELRIRYRAWLADDASSRLAEVKLARLVAPYADLSPAGRTRYLSVVSGLDDADQTPVLPDVSQFEEITDWRGPRGSRKAVALSLLPPVDRILAVLADLRDGQDVLRQFRDDIAAAPGDASLERLLRKINETLPDR